mgnify:CR=1 FL=1
MKIAGLDIGSTGCKLTIFDSDGSCLGKAYRDYPVKRTKTAHEVEAQDIIDSVFEVMEEMGRRHPDIAGIGVTSFGETFVLTDKAGCPLHTAMLYTDPRGADECRALEEELGSAEIAAVTGLKPHGMYSLPKIMWIKGHWPEVYRRAEHILLMEDFVVFLLTGTAQIVDLLGGQTSLQAALDDGDGGRHSAVFTDELLHVHSGLHILGIGHTVGDDGALQSHHGTALCHSLLHLGRYIQITIHKSFTSC